MTEKNSDSHKFKQDSGMSFEEVYRFAYTHFISLIRSLAGKLDREDFVELLQRASSDAVVADARRLAESLPSNDFEAWTGTMREPNRFWTHVLTTKVVEDTKKAFEVSITECLWAKTFREADAADLGYAMICHPDYAYCQAFNPKIRMIRTKTLMQGDECCNHRWVMDG
jgi:hypothetical protein